MRIQEAIEQSIAVKQNIIENKVLIDTIQKIADEIIKCYKNGGKVLFCGNGGVITSYSIHYTKLYDGGGGFMFFYCPGNTRFKVIRELEKLGGDIKRYQFVTQGLQTWTVK